MQRCGSCLFCLYLLPQCRERARSSRRTPGSPTRNLSLKARNCLPQAVATRTATEPGATGVVRLGFGAKASTPITRSRRFLTACPIRPCPASRPNCRRSRSGNWLRLFCLIQRRLAIQARLTACATPPASPVKPAGTISAPLVGNAQAGKTLFFDSSKPKSCHACHSFNGEGTQIGPDLSSAAATRSPRALFSSIVLVTEIRDPKYASITVSLRSGEKIVGVKKEEDAESLRVYDTSELPAVLRTIQKENVATIEQSNESVMPRDYASVYTMKQLLDLVTFLKSANSRSPVTLKELVE